MISAPIWDKLTVNVLSRAFVGGGQTNLLSRASEGSGNETSPNSLSGQSASFFSFFFFSKTDIRNNVQRRHACPLSCM